MTREELIQELEKSRCPVCKDCHIIESVDEYVKSEKRLLLEKIGKPLRELQAMVKGECPSLLNEDSGGNARLDMEIDEALVIIEKEGGE